LINLRLPSEVVFGSEVFTILSRLASTASSRVYIASYVAILSPHLTQLISELRRAVRRGVDVRVVLNGGSDYLREVNGPAYRSLSSAGIPVRLTSVFTHAKLYVVDDVIITGSHNLSPAVSSRFELSLMVRSGLPVERVFEPLWLGSLPPPAVYTAHLQGGGVVRMLASREVLSSVLDLVVGAEEWVYFAVYIATLSKHTSKIYRSLASKAREGVDVAVVLDGVGRKSRRYNYRVASYLSGLGVRVFVPSEVSIHSKVFASESRVIVGSHNLSAASHANRFELALEVESSYLARSVRRIVETVLSGLGRRYIS